VSVTDADGNPVAAAAVAFEELGETLASDDEGGVSWADLPGEAASLSVTAQGYLPAETTATLERGPNEVTVALERDPFGLLPAEACAPGESPVYIEDFQDKRAQGWTAIDFQTAGWALVDDPAAAGDIAAVLTSPEHTGDSLQTLDDQPLVVDNGVWRLRFMITGAPRQLSFNWRHPRDPYEIEQGEVNDSRYQIILGTTDPAHARRLQQPLLNVGLTNGSFRAKADTWYFVEISTFDSRIEVWVDGLSIMGFTDPNPIPPGGIGLELFPPQGEDTAVYFDDMSLCELSAVFAPLPTATPAPTTAP
jgi:hypothetical protein